MQVVWSRVAQTRSSWSSCRCTACLHAASVVTGRTTAASKRRLKIGDIFTACYTTILGTAVFADARVKEERRKQWDRVIAEAKAGIRIYEQERVERTVVELDQAQELPSPLRSVLSPSEMVLRKVAEPDGTSLTSSRSARDDAVDIILNSHFKQALATPTEISQITRPPASAELESDWPDESDTGIADREPRKEIHLDKMEEMVTKLVARLLLRSKDQSTMGVRCVSQTDGSRESKDIMEQLETLQGSGTRLPSYAFLDQRAAAMDQKRLNNAIEAVFESTGTNQSNTDLLLAKICYNLLVSSTPPNIHTYNIMIRCLTRLRLHELAQVVVDSFLFNSKFKPSSETVQLLLNHYSTQKDLPGFRAIVDRMRAVNADMRIKRRTLDSLDKPPVQEWARTKKVTKTKSYINEKVTRDSDMFDSLINGFLELEKLRSAVRYLRAALREGMQVSSKTLLRIVQACTTTLDYRAGLSVLRSLLRQWEGDSSSTIVYSSKARLAVHQLLGLCAIDTSPYSTRPLPWGVSREAVINLERHISIVSIEDKLSCSAKLITSLEAVLHDSQTRSGLQRAQKALALMRNKNGLERTRSAQKRANNAAATAMSRSKPCDYRPWLEAQSQKLSEEWKTMYDAVIERDPNLTWSDRLEILSFWRQGKNVPRTHRLYTAVLTNGQLRRRGLSRWQGYGEATTQSSVAAGEKPAKEDKSKLGLQIRSKQPSQRVAPQVIPRIPPLPEPMQTLALDLPLAPTSMDTRLYITSG